MKEFNSIIEYNAALSRLMTQMLPVNAMKEVLTRSRLRNPKTIDGAFAIKQMVIAVDFAEMHNNQLQEQYNAMNTESFKQANIEGYGV